MSIAGGRARRRLARTSSPSPGSARDPLTLERGRRAAVVRDYRVGLARAAGARRTNDRRGGRVSRFARTSRLRCPVSSAPQRRCYSQVRETPERAAMLRLVVHALQALALCLASAQSSTRQWKPNTNMDDPRSWNATALCSNDKLVFPADVRAVVFVQRNYTLQELRLPNNGIMTVAEGVSLMFSSLPDRGQKKGCTRQGRVLTFSAGTPRSWFDPKNWCVGKECADDDSVATYVDSEIVPCQNNDVIFPENSTFSVDVHSNHEPIAVRQVVLRGTMYNSSGAFNTYYNGDVGLKEFVTTEAGSRTKVSISSRGCTDRAGCICGNTHEYMEELVCASRQCPASLPCRHPVKADGNCCPSCGTLLNISIGNDFNMTYFRQVLADAVVQTKPALELGARWAATKVAESQLQVLTLPPRGSGATDDGRSATELGCLVNDFLRARIAELQLGIADVRAVNSNGYSCDKSPINDASTQAETKRDTVIGIMIGLAVVIIIGVLIFIYRKSLYWKLRTLTSDLKIPRVRFDGKTAEVQAFQNPAYDDVPLPFSIGDDKTAVAFDARNQTIVGFENSLYPEHGAAFNLAAVGGQAVAGSSSFFDSLPMGLSAGRNFGRRSRSTAAAGTGFDNPLFAGQNGTWDANASQTAANGAHSVAALQQKAVAKGSADDGPAAAAADGAPSRLSWVSKLRLPKLLTSATSPTASAKVVDEKGFSNPLYQSPTVENLSFSPAGVAYSPSSSSRPHDQQTSGPVGGAGPLLDDDFLNGAADGNAASVMAELIL